jgi:hypothetical protein
MTTSPSAAPHTTSRTPSPEPPAPGDFRRVAWTLVAIVLVFIAANIARVPHEPTTPDVTVTMAKAAQRAAPFDMDRDTRKFIWHQLDLDREANLSTWVSTVQLAVIGALALALASLRRRRGWLWIGLGFLYLSADELAQIHEWVGDVMWHSPFRLGFIAPPYPWVLLFGPPFLIFSIWMVRFAARELAEWPDLRRRIWLGLLLLFLAIPLEVVGGKLEGVSARLLRVESTTEETCELMGEIVLLVALLNCVARSITPRVPARRDP